MNSGDIANFHSIFNISVTLVLLPFAGLLEKLACKIVRDNPSEEDGDEVGINLDERFLRSPGLALEHAKNCVVSMGRLSYKNLGRVTSLFENYDLKVVEKVKEKENVIDKLEDRVSSYLIKLSEEELTEAESRKVSTLLQIQSEFERVGDYAINISECAQHLFETDSQFSPSALQEIQAISDAVAESIYQAIEAFESSDITRANNIEPLEEVIDMMEETLKDRHIERLKKGKCSVDAAFPFVESLSNYERIGDHCANVAMYMITESAQQQNIDRHEYRRMLHMGLSEYYSDLFQQYKDKYYKRIQIMQK